MNAKPVNTPLTRITCKSRLYSIWALKLNLYEYKI